MITVIVKSSRIHHHFKFWGGLLNPQKHYYTRKMEAKNINQLRDALK